MKSRIFEAFGESKTIKQWSYDARCSVSENIIRRRIWDGMSIEIAITSPVRKTIVYNCINKIYGNILILKISGKDKRGQTLVECECLRNNCHNIFIANFNHITGGYKNSCGCGYFLKNKENWNWKGYEGISRTLFNQWKNSAKIRNKSFDLTIEELWELFIKQNRKCALSGIELNISSYFKNRDTTASLDCIDATKGYDRDNIQFVHKTINLMKNNIPQDKFIEFCGLIYKNKQIDISSYDPYLQTR